MAAAARITVRERFRVPRQRPVRDLERIAAAPRASLGGWPTPVHSIELPKGPPILVKRDDLSAFGRGGAKTRKIEHLLGHLRAHGHDELVATAGNVTNLIFDLLPALDQVGIRGRLFIINDPVALPEDREKIFAGVRGRIELLDARRSTAARSMFDAWREGRRAGRKPFVAFPGVSHPSGVLGNATGFIEMMTQLRDSGAELPSTVYVTAATGTTVAGFLLAEHALREAGWPAVRVVGVQVYPGAIRHWTRALLRWTEWQLGLTSRVPAARIEIRDAALHGGFGRFPSALAELCERVENEHGLRLDPVFGGKTWSQMEREIVSDARPTMYWHCGFTPEWRVLGRVIDRVVRS